MQFFLESKGTPGSMFKFKGSYTFDSSLGISSFISSLLHDRYTSIILTTPRIPTTAITTPAVKFPTPVELTLLSSIALMAASQTTITILYTNTTTKCCLLLPISLMPVLM